MHHSNITFHQICACEFISGVLGFNWGGPACSFLSFDLNIIRFFGDILVHSKLLGERHHGSLGLTLHHSRSFLTPQGRSLGPHMLEKRDSHSRPERPLFWLPPPPFRKTMGASEFFHDLCSTIFFTFLYYFLVKPNLLWDLNVSSNKKGRKNNSVSIQTSVKFVGQLHLRLSDQFRNNYSTLLILYEKKETFTFFIIIFIREYFVLVII